MAGSSENITDVLTELAEFVKDRQESYKKAAADTDNALFKKFYQELSDQQAGFATQLEAVVKPSGSNADKESAAIGNNVVGEYYLQWVEAKEKFVSRDEHTIVELNIDGEEWAQKAYTNALENYQLPEEVKQIIEKQKEVSLKNLTSLTGMKASD